MAMVADAVVISARQGRLPRPRLVAAVIRMQRPCQTRGGRPGLLGGLETHVPAWEDASVSTPLGRRHPAATEVSCGDGTAGRNRL